MSLVGFTLHCKMQPLFALFSFRLIFIVIIWRVKKVVLFQTL